MQPVTTILGCHFRLKGEVDGNPEGGGPTEYGTWFTDTEGVGALEKFNGLPLNTQHYAYKNAACNYDHFFENRPYWEWIA